MIPIVVNTTPTYHDVADIFLKQKRIFAPEYQTYIFSENSIGLNLEAGEILFKYEKSNFRDEYLQCLTRVPNDFVITSNDDYFLTDYPNENRIKYMLDVLLNSDYSFIRLHKGFNKSSGQIFENLFALSSSDLYYYTQGLSIWRTCDLEKLFRATPPSGIGRKQNELQFENLANEYIHDLGLRGLYFYDKEKKRGLYHYDCSVMPHVASAIVDGGWNYAEYPSELSVILGKWNVDVSIRGRYDYTAYQKIRRYLTWKY